MSSFPDLVEDSIDLFDLSDGGDAMSEDLDSDFQALPGDIVTETLVAVTQLRPAQLRTELNLVYLNPSEILVIDGWFHNSLGKSYHTQVREIALALQALTPKTSYQRIGIQTSGNCGEMARKS
jgi:hypothetical protein